MRDEGLAEIIIIGPADKVTLEAGVSGFAHGYGLFETIKLSGDCLCFWEAHWARFSNSAACLGMRLEFDAETVLAAIRRLVRNFGVSEGVVKLSLLREGEVDRLYVYMRPAFPLPSRRGVKLIQTSPLNPDSLLAGHKTHNYMENMILLERCRAEGFLDVLRVDTSGMLAETATANIFFVKGGQLYTPGLETGILPGVVRAALLELTTVKVGRFSSDVLMEAEAVFLTNSSVGLLPVDLISGPATRLPLQSEGHPLLQDLRKKFAESEASASVAL